MEIMVATMLWHVLGLQMILSGHTKMVQGARRGFESWLSPSDVHLHTVRSFIGKPHNLPRTPLLCRVLPP